MSAVLQSAAAVVPLPLEQLPTKSPPISVVGYAFVGILIGIYGNFVVDALFRGAPLTLGTVLLAALWTGLTFAYFRERIGHGVARGFFAGLPVGGAGIVAAALLCGALAHMFAG